MWSRRIFIPLLLACLGSGASSQTGSIDLGDWASREDRLLLVFLLDGLDERRVDEWGRDGTPLLPGLRELRSGAIVFDDVQSGAIGVEAGLRHLFSTTPLDMVEGSPAEISLRVRDAARDPRAQRLVLATELFRDPVGLDDDFLLSCDPAPWTGHHARNSEKSQRDMRSRRAEMLHRLYVERRPIRRGNNAEDMRWIGDAMHIRADRNLSALWEILMEEEVRARSLVVISARVGAADPERGAPAPTDALRPDLVDVPFWLLTPAREGLRIGTPQLSGTLMRSFWELDETVVSWRPPEAQPSRWSFHLPPEAEPVTAALYWRHPEWSLLLRHDGAHELYDRRNDPDEWEKLAVQQSESLTALRERAARETLGEHVTVFISNRGSETLLIQPADSIRDLRGDASRREGPLLRLEGPGTWEFELEATKEIRVRSTRPDLAWKLGQRFRLEAPQIQLSLGRAELLHALDWSEATTAAEEELQISVRAGEGGILHRP